MVFLLHESQQFLTSMALLELIVQVFSAIYADKFS